jgi:Hemerythrin HHE cation binding domain
LSNIIEGIDPSPTESVRCEERRSDDDGAPVWAMKGPVPEGDVVDFLVHDHDTLRRLVSGYVNLPAPEQEERFGHLVDQLIRHETAEERVIYPAVRADTLPGETISDLLLQQEHLINSEFKAAQTLGIGSSVLCDVFETLQSHVLEHFRDEEVKVVPVLQNLESDVRRWELGDRYVRAVRAAHGRPRGRLPYSGPGGGLIGSIGSMIDRARTAVDKIGRH